MLRVYLNQEATHEPLTSIDDRGGFQYGTPTVIKCRKRKRTQEVLTADRQLLKSMWVYYVTDPVCVDDKLDGQMVLLVEEWITLKGTLLGYKVTI